MGTANCAQFALLIVAHFSCQSEVLSWSQEVLTKLFGPVSLVSELFPFSETDYYSKTMGDDLKLQMLCFEEVICPDQLASIKQQTNQIEADYAAVSAAAEKRPLNLDPGYITASKFVLATTKDASHRIYLKDGIFAETTLGYVKGAWRAFQWTYPNYQRADYQQFLCTCRKLFLERMRQ